MGADQRKRRLSSSNDFGHALQVQDGVKKKKSVSRLYDLNPHISLKWDKDEKRVVAKGEQIGLSWRHLSSFIAACPHQKSSLADVITVPTDVFDLNNLKELVSYEAWRSLISDQDRNYLKQFLPGEIDPEQVVNPLLEGDNFNFGSPFMKWGTSLCSGDLHPDAIIHQEHLFRANKKAYYSDLQKYHENMIGYLQTMKDNCVNSSDPEAVIITMMRSRIVTEVNERKFHNPGENVAITTESSSWIAEEKACSGDNLNLSEINGHELQKSRHLEKYKIAKPAVSPEGLTNLPKAKHGEKKQKLNTNYDYGTKYMSYIKISKKQYELVKSLKHSGNSIQFKALNHVLGNLDNVHVKPYEMFEKEEKNKMLEYWSNLAKKDIPAAFVNWKERKPKRFQITRLCQEMEGKSDNQIEDVDETLIEVSQHQGDEGAADQSILDDNSESHASSMEDQSFQIPSSKVRAEFNHVDLNADHTVALETRSCDGSSDVRAGHQNILDYPENQKQARVDKNEQLCVSAIVDAWHPANIHNSFFGTSSSVEYTSSGNLSLRHQIGIKEQPGSFVDLGSEILEEDPTRDFLHQQSIDMPYLNCQNHHRDDMLPSFLKHESCPEEKRTELDFKPKTNIWGQLQQPFALGHGEKVGNDMFMPPNGLGKIYPNSNRAALPVQEHFSPMRIDEWANNCVMAPEHPNLESGEMLNYSWGSHDNRDDVGWSGPEAIVFSNQNQGGRSTGDQSLFSVLPQYNNLHSLPPLSITGSVTPTMNFGEGMGAVIIPQTANHLSQGTSPLEYYSVQEAAAAEALNTSSMGWRLPHQISLPDPTEKLFLRSWNQ